MCDCLGSSAIDPSLVVGYRLVARKAM
jgi:hypothetical protein